MYLLRARTDTDLPRDSDVSGSSDAMSSHKYNLRNTPQKNDTPQKDAQKDKAKIHEPVFRTPMSFSPRVTGDLARPSPSRHEIWKAQLGFDDGDMSTGDEGSGSDMDAEDEDKENNPLNETCSMLEYQALVKELNERNSQRDELVLKLKNLSDKNKQYKQRVERDELAKKQQIKILRKTHETSLQEKENLIRNLESIIDEHECKIAELQESLKGGNASGPSEKLGLHRLVKQITQLQEKNTELTQRALTAENHLEELTVELKRVQAAGADGDRERNELQEEIIKLRDAKGNGSTDDQKLVHKLENENDELRSKLRETQQQLLTAKSEITSPKTAKAEEDLVNSLKEENEQQQKKLSALESELNEHRLSGERAQSAEVKRLSAENQALSQEVRTLKSQLLGLQAKSPEVVTKIKTVEVESKGLQQECEQLKSNLTNEKDKLKTLNCSYEQLQLEYKSVSKQLKQVQCEYDSTASQLKQLQSGQESLGDNISELHKNNHELELKYQKSCLENESLKTDLEESQSSTQKTKAEVIRLEGDNEKLTSQLKQTTHCVEELRKEIAEAQSQITKKDADLELMLRETNTLQGELESRQSQLAAATTELNSANERGSQLQHQLEQYGEEVTLLQKQMETELDDLKTHQENTVQKLKAEHEAHVHDLTQRMNNTIQCLSFIVPSFEALKSDYAMLKQLCLSLPKMFKSDTGLVMKQVCDGIAEIHEHNQELVKKYRKEMTLRKKYHNELVELKGNIRVFCRVRPKIKEDGQGPTARSIMSFDAEDNGVINVQHKGRVQSFELDRVFSADYHQEQVYNEVTSLVTSCVDGYNVCIFAYGQTGSGKTYTMEGTMNEPGMNQRALSQLFEETSERSHASEYTIHVSVLEIYNEMIRDLLSSVPTNKLDVKLNPEGGVHVPGLTFVQVGCVEDVNEVFALGRKNRVTASTNMNEHSSRSHALLRVRVVGRNLASGAKTIGVMNLVDLAGSERVSKSGADGARLKEAQNINKSLSSLGDVIQALRTRQTFVPYRNSKLTYLLQDSLGGDSKTLMITQISPVERNCAETLASLNFAQRVRTVELGQATKKSESAEVAELKTKLAQYEDVAQFTPTSKGSATKLSPPNKIQRQK